MPCGYTVGMGRGCLLDPRRGGILFPVGIDFLPRWPYLLRCRVLALWGSALHRVDGGLRCRYDNPRNPCLQVGRFLFSFSLLAFSLFLYLVLASLNALFIYLFLKNNRWLYPHLKGDMVAPVALYCIVITIMVVVAAGMYGGGDNTPYQRNLLIAAVLFYISDITVARDR